MSGYCLSNHFTAGHVTEVVNNLISWEKYSCQNTIILTVGTYYLYQRRLVYRNFLNQIDKNVLCRIRKTISLLLWTYFGVYWFLCKKLRIPKYVPINTASFFNTNQLNWGKKTIFFQRNTHIPGLLKSKLFI